MRYKDGNEFYQYLNELEQNIKIRYREMTEFRNRRTHL